MRTVRRAAAAGGLALAGLYTYEALQYKRTAAVGFDMDELPRVDDPAFGRLIEALTGAPLRTGNRVTILRNGCEIFPAMLEAIESAEHSIDFATYVYWAGDIAPRFANALIARARAGVQVNVLLDAMGAAKMDRSLIDALCDAGARVAWFRPIRWYNLEKLSNRTHRKILVVDGKTGFTGGVGIAEEWTGDCEDPGHWRDTHVRVEGSAARDLLGGFLENWAEATRHILTGSHLPDVHPHADGVRVQVSRSSAAKGSTEAEELFYAAISAAQKKLWITTAYFAPRQAFIDALCDAVSRGVDVRVLTNGPHIDKEVVRRAGNTAFEALLERGVRVFEYRKTMMHAKIMTVDNAWRTIGSINFDNRSFALNDELNLSVLDPEVVALLDEHFVEDLEGSVELDLERWRNRPVARRARERLSAVVRREL